MEGDSRNLDIILTKQGIRSGSAALVCTHPPYMDSLRYSRRKDDLSTLSNTENFIIAMREVAAKIKWALREHGICAILVGDIRKRGKIIPLGFELLRIFLEEGFQLCDIIIKVQRRDLLTEFYRHAPWFKHMIAHEYLLIFQK